MRLFFTSSINAVKEIIDLFSFVEPMRLSLIFSDQVKQYCDSISKPKFEDMENIFNNKYKIRGMNYNYIKSLDLEQINNTLVPVLLSQLFCIYEGWIESLIKEVDLET